MKIDVGDNAPDFSMESVNSGTVSLADYRGRKVVLVFGRYFGCPVCQDDFDALLEMSGKTDEAIVYFTQSLEGSARKYLEGYDVPFPVVSVPKTTGYQLYTDYNVGMMGFNTMLGILRRSGVAKKKGKVHGDHEGRETQSPADFVVDENGKIVWANLGLFDANSMMKFLEP
jgi:peroxiredoxin Q/BCP